MSAIMTEEMVEIAQQIYELKIKYSRMYYEVNTWAPVLWIKHDENGDSIMLVNECCTDRLIDYVTYKL